MEHGNNRVAALAGSIGGVGKFLLASISEHYVVQLGEAAVTAFVCGVVGIAGKETYLRIKRKYFKK